MQYRKSFTLSPLRRFAMSLGFSRCQRGQWIWYQGQSWQYVRTAMDSGGMFVMLQRKKKHYSHGYTRHHKFVCVPLYDFAPLAKWTTASAMVMVIVFMLSFF